MFDRKVNFAIRSFFRLEVVLGRVINPERPGKERNQLSRAVVLALRELMRQTEPDENSRDLAAFISIALLEIFNTVDLSVTAWEKKGYWLKADRFRMEWEWSSQLGKTIGKAVLQDDWAAVAAAAAKVAQKLMSVEVPARHRLGTPWVGAWRLLQAEYRSQLN